MVLQTAFRAASPTPRRLSFRNAGCAAALPAGGPPARRLDKAPPPLAALMRRWRDQIRSVRQARELARLSDHQLRDIGLSRDALCWAAERAFARGRTR